MAHYPADTFQEATEIAIEASNQLHGVINGDANAEVTVEDGSTIPSIRKAQTDSMYFKEPENWISGQTETDYLQLKKYIDPTTNKESWWFAKSALVSNPVAMGTSPFGDSNWYLYTPEDLFISGKAEYESIYQALKGKAAEAGYNLVRGSFEEGGTLTGTSDVLWYQTNGKYYSWFDGSAKTVVAESTPATSGAWIDRSDVSLRAEITPSVTEALRRSYAEAGYNLVDGSFESGGTLTNTNDVLLHKASGIAYSYSGGFPHTATVGTDPTVGGSGYATKANVILRDDLSGEAGSSMVGHKLNGETPATTVSLKLRERVTIKDFGAVGNDSFDNTGAFADAVEWMIANGRNVIINEGSFVTSPFQVFATTYASQVGFIGMDKNRSIIKRLSNGSTPFITFGSPTQTLFCVTNPLTNMSVNGGANTNGDTVVTYDLVRSVINDVKFSGGTTALRMYGGISVRVKNFTLESAKVGFKATKYASQVGGAGGGWPNLITLSGGELVDNIQWGAYFDDGRMLRIRDCDIEGNGSSGFSGGGLYIGAGVGDEVEPGNMLSIAANLDNVWFESNVGVADFVQDGGYNRLKDCTFHSIGTVNDFSVTAGRYVLDHCDSTFTKTVNVNEGSGVFGGNSVMYSEFQNLTYDPNKTEVRTATSTNLRNGGIQSANGYAAPRELTGTDNSNAVVNVTLNPAFKTGTTPRVYTQVISDDNTASHYAVEVWNITNAGFSMRKKKVTGGTATATNFNVQWRAIGEAN